MEKKLVASNTIIGNQNKVVEGNLDEEGTLTGHIYAPEYINAYQVAVENGFEGSITAWLETSRGPRGFRGYSAYQLAVKNGFPENPPEGGLEAWLKSLVGPEGKSAFELAQEEGFEGDLDQWLESLGVVSKHNELIGRDLADCHPMSAISDLDSTFSDVNKEIDKKQDTMICMTAQDILDICTI